MPNERSSHTTPTVRGGGLVIVFVCLISYTFYTLLITNNFQISYVIGAALIALVSWVDDLYSISFVWRIFIHSISAILIIFTLGYFQEIYIPFFSKIENNVIGAFLTFCWIVWLTNAYNFMDGIDGIAGMQAVTAGIGWMILGKLLEFPMTEFYGGTIAFSSLGFLIQNWQPAKIFMGDVGSAFLGFSFAALPLLAKDEIGQSGEKNQYLPYLPIIAILFVWLFIFDTVYTFIRRIYNQEKVWEAHRGHIYQKLTIAGYSHQKVTSLFGLLSILTTSVAILWTINKSVWEYVLILLASFQIIGLLLYMHFQKK